MIDDFHDGIGRKQSLVLGKKDKEESVEELLAFFIEQELVQSRDFGLPYPATVPV
jgi:hypothetical protein